MPKNPLTVERRSNISWYMPKAKTAQLLGIFQQLVAMKADTDAQTQGTHSENRPAAQKRPLARRDG